MFRLYTDIYHMVQILLFKEQIYSCEVENEDVELNG